MSFFPLWVSPSVHSVVVIWYGWGLGEVNSMSFLGSNIISTLSNSSSLISPFSWMSFLPLRVGPGIHSVVVIWYGWGLSKMMCSLSGNIVSTLGNFSSFVSPFGWMSFFLLWVSPGVDSVVVIWNSRSLSKVNFLSSLSSNVVSTLSNLSSFISPLSWMSFFPLWVSPSVHSVVVIWHGWGGFLHKSIICTISLPFSFVSPFSWMIFFPLCISPCIDSVVVSWNIWE